jgi:ribulose-phosphate 3-epimerase
VIIPTILEKNTDEILKKVKMLQSSVPHIQIDIVDPKLFKGETVLDLGFLEKIDSNITIELDLLVMEPLKFLAPNLKNVTKISANIAGKDIDSFIYKSIDHGYLTGISFNPDTTMDQYDTIVDGLDYVQFISVVPGGQGRTFEQKVIGNIKDFMSKYPDMPVQVDGGLDASNIKTLLEIGVTSFVVGSSIFNAVDPVESYNNLVKVIHDGE